MLNGWDNELRSLGQRVRDLRRQRGLSQNSLAAQAGLDRTYLGDIEHGRINLSLLNIAKIARTLDVEIIDLFR